MRAMSVHAHVARHCRMANGDPLREELIAASDAGCAHAPLGRRGQAPPRHLLSTSLLGAEDAFSCMRIMRFLKLCKDYVIKSRKILLFVSP